MIKCKKWNGKDLRGEWAVYRKLDGVRALVIRERVVSRKGKPLYNLDRHATRFTDAEVWLGDFKRTIQAVRTSSRAVAIPRSAIYPLDPPDVRLILRWTANPTAAAIRVLLKRYKRKGEDGLVLRQGDRWLKVKHEDTYDVKVTGVLPGKGKHRGRLGALLTTMGRVGTGFSDKLRGEKRNALALHWVGKTIEVACTQLTPAGKFRHVRFVRVREDK